MMFAERALKAARLSIMLIPSARKGVRGMLPQDAAMLLSTVNLKLRDFYKSLEEMCDDLDEDAEQITQRLAQIGYHYDRERNQFV